MSHKDQNTAKQSLAKRLKGLSPEKRKLFLKRLGEKDGSPPQKTPEPIAVIGMSCRFPGGADSPEAFWSCLSEKRDMISEMSDERWRSSILNKRQLSAEDKKLLHWGGFIHDIDRFDPAFFDLSPREAATMDPQQRLAMEVAWEALESAGQTLDTLKGGNTGIFLGLHSESSDYYWIQLGSPAGVDTHAATGGAHAIAANRISYFLDLRGPSMVVDTACSSSLVAVHLACQSLRSQECEMALAGGVNLVLSPENSYAFSKLQFLSPDGRCKTFDATANGYVRGEGCGVIVLRRLSDAMKKGDPILALIRGSAVNQDGASNGLTAPSGLSQQNVLKLALKNANVSPDKIGYVETHGTGTPLGDPIEVESLATVLGKADGKVAPCILGAVKSNIGHLEAAAGIAGLIKIVLCMKHRQIPANLHFNELNSNISLKGTRFEIPVTHRDWTGNDGERFAGVSSFGFGGTNAHIILQDPYTAESQRSEIRKNKNAETCRIRLLPLSARSEKSLYIAADRWRKFLSIAEAPPSSIDDICYTAAVRRTHHDRRLAVVGESQGELIEHIEKILKERLETGNRDTKENTSQTGGLVFVFSGQGPQWYGMGRILASRETVYREMIERCDAELRSYTTDWSLLNELQKDEATSRLNQTEIAQPALFALQMGLAALWDSWGICPDGVVGHSAGEVAAACFSGILPLEDAIKVIYHRGRLLQRLTGHGRMAAANLASEEAERIIADYQGRLSIGAVNSPSSITLTGAEDAINHVLKRLSQQNIFCRQLPVDYAFHSPQTETLEQEMIDSVAGIKALSASIDVMSTVTGQPAIGADYGAAYWAENIRQPVQFARAVDRLITTGHSSFLEISPHPVLAMSISQCLDSRNIEGKVLHSLRRGKDDTRAVLDALGELYMQGQNVKWTALYSKTRCTVQLPSYPWHKKSCWIQYPDKTTAKRAIAASTLAQTIVGHPIRSKNLAEPVIEFDVSPGKMAHIRDHLLIDEPILPASVVLQMCDSAVSQLFGKHIVTINEMHIDRMLRFSDGKGKKIQIIFEIVQKNSLKFELVIVPEFQTEDWESIAGGTVLLSNEHESEEMKSFAPDKFQEHVTDEIKGEDFYRSIEKSGVRFGPSYHSIASAWLSKGLSTARFHNPSRQTTPQGCSCFDPAIFDSALLLLLQSGLYTRENTECQDPYLFVGFEKLELLSRTATPLLCKAKGHDPIGNEVISGNITLLDANDTCIAKITGARLKRAPRETFTTIDRQPADLSVLSVRWRPLSVQVSGKGLDGEGIIPSTGAIRQRAEQESLNPMPEARQVQQGRLLSELDRLCTAGIIGCLDSLGWHMSPHSIVSKDEIALHVGAKNHHRRLFDRMMEILVEDGILAAADSHLRVVSRPDSVSLKIDIAHLLNEYPDYAIELELLQKCLKELPNVIRGECDPMDLLFPGGSIETVEELYRNSPVFRYNNETAAKIVSSISDLIPEDRTIKILEIGAGTGGTTSFILPVLTQRKVNYTFTDVSNYFLDKMKQRFGNFPFVSFDILDIERDVQTRNNFTGKFDLVIAANVLHATKNLKNTLQNVSSLTAPNGLLLLIEGVRPARWIDMIFGLTSGWWLFSDSSLRDKHPLLKKHTWVDVLQQSGFKDTVLFFDHHENNNVLFRQAVILTRAGKKTSQTGIPDGVGNDKLTKFQPKRRWLVLCDTPTAFDCATALETHGIQCTLIDIDVRQDSPDSSSEYTERIKSAINGLIKQSPEAFENVLYFPGEDVRHEDDTPPGHPTGDISTATALSCSRLALLVNILLNQTQSLPPRIWIVTRGAQTVTENEKPNLHHSSVWGFGRVLATEHPDLWGGLIDLDPASTMAKNTSNIVEQVIYGTNERQAAFRGNQRFVPSLISTESTLRSNLDLENKTVLITGGLGALGLKTAHWLAEEGVSRLILISRRSLPNRSQWPESGPHDPNYEIIQRIRKIESLGAVVKTAPVDVADRGQMESFLNGLFSEDWRPINAVVHAAGSLKDQPIYQLDTESLKEVLRPKMNGALLLDNLLSKEPVDFFIYFSSIGALLGQKGQASYASANAFLDGMAAFQRANHKRALSINWGPWEKAGFAETTGAEKTIAALSKFGILPIKDWQALKAMGFLLQRNETQGAILGTNAADFSKLFPQDVKVRSLNKLYSSILDLDEKTAQKGSLYDSQEILNSLVSMAPGPEKRSLMESHLAALLAGVLAMDKALVNYDDPFGTMGLDSLMALEFKNQCERFYGIKLPATVVWRYPTIRVLSAQLAKMIGIPLSLAEHENKEHPQPVPGDVADIKEDFLQKIDHLSDEEALNELLRKK